MRMIARSLVLALAISPFPALAGEGEVAGVKADCVVGICQIRMTPQQLLARAETLVLERRFSEAMGLIDALAQAPEMRLQARFLAGYSASEQGDFRRAADLFKSILADDPKQTRVRLELARAMLGMGQTASANRQFRIAQQDDLPPDIARLVRGARDVIRSQRLWRLDMDFGIAPDSNITNATSANTVDIRLGDTTLPISLDDGARARSGTGQVASLNAGVRLPVSGNAAMLVDASGSGTNYSGARYDDYQFQLAAGPQLHLSDDANISAQAVGAQRWYGGSSASRQLGVRLGGQLTVSDKARVGLQLDARNTVAQFDRNYSGWQVGLYANGEHALSRTFVATAGIFGRRDALRASTYSNAELGGSLGIAGELPWGINIGANGTVSRALYDAPMAIFSAEPRKDWRLGANLSLGYRKVRVFGFSPQVNIGYSRTLSSLPFFANDRLRFRFAAARYF